MPVVQKQWVFLTTVEGWAQVSPSLPTAALAYLGSDGDPSNGCLQMTRDHDIGDGVQKYRSALETWEAWGVPATGEVLQVRLTLKAKTANGTTTQTVSARILDNTLTTVTSDGDLIVSQSLPAPSSWTTITGSLRNVDFLAQESTQPVRLEIEINAIEAGIEASDFRFDTLTLDITYDDGSGGDTVAVPISNLDGLVFMKGFAYASRIGGTPDAVGMAALQECSIQHAYGTAEARGPESLQPIGVGITEETLSGSIRHMVLNAEQLQVFLGGTASYNGGTGRTTFTKLTDQEPSPFNLHLKTPDDGSDMEVYVYNALATSMPIIEGGANREFKTFGIDWRAYGQTTAQGKKLFEVLLPGNQTGSS